MSAAARAGARRFPHQRETRPGTRLVLLGVGSNHGATETIPRALEELAYEFDVLAKSTRYVGPPEPREGQEPDHDAPRYSNVSVLIRTPEDHITLRARLKELERELGRDRTRPGEVAIDLDILLIAGERVIADDGQVLVPHPDLTTKRYAAIPSAEVAPSMRLPGRDDCVADVAARLA